MTQWTLHVQHQQRGAQFAPSAIPSRPSLFGNHHGEESHRLRGAPPHVGEGTLLANAVTPSAVPSAGSWAPLNSAPSQAACLALSDNSEAIASL